jgi:putative RNA 2'-phosphotransferase
MEKKLNELSKNISYALRHAPWEYELELDHEGWVDVEKLLLVFRKKKEWVDINVSDLIEMINQSSKKRHELKDGKIRALYGHSTSNKLIKQPAEPPQILYHGTSPEVAEIVFNTGLKPMNRQYVHLSVDTETAKQVGYRKSSSPKLLIIRAKEAYLEGVHFYIGNEHVWLADGVPPKYIDIGTSNI